MLALAEMLSRKPVESIPSRVSAFPAVEAFVAVVALSACFAWPAFAAIAEDGTRARLDSSTSAPLTVLFLMSRPVRDSSLTWLPVMSSPAAAVPPRERKSASRATIMAGEGQRTVLVC
jgi:hypothetical protein